MDNKRDNNGMGRRLLAFTMILMLVLMCLASRHLDVQRRSLQIELDTLQQQLRDLETELARNRALLDEAARRTLADTELLDRLRQWLNTWQVEAFETTAYAPFESGGLCHDGTPSITAAGTKPAPGTIAVDPRQIPFGTPLFVQDYGWGKALDTGAAMRSAPRRLDLFFPTRSEALAWGRRSVLVIRPKNGFHIRPQKE